MKISIHKSESRGKSNIDWLKSYHTYSFSSYYNPERNGFGQLRVINDDTVQPSQGFDTHSHQNMEIISIPIEGSLRHKDSMGNEHVIQSGEVQIMSAGTGVTHSEYNNSAVDDVNFLQIWIMPKMENIPPYYDQKYFDKGMRHNQSQLIISPDGDGNSLKINQDCYCSLSNISKESTVDYPLYTSKNGVYMFVISGRVTIGSHILERRDGAEISNTPTIHLTAQDESEVLLIETPIEVI